MRILRLPDVQLKTGLKHTTIYDKIARGEFPKPIPLSAKAKGFVESEIEDWIHQQIAKRDGAAA